MQRGTENEGHEFLLKISSVCLKTHPNVLKKSHRFIMHIIFYFEPIIVLEIWWCHRMLTLKTKEHSGCLRHRIVTPMFRVRRRQQARQTTDRPTCPDTWDTWIKRSLNVWLMSRSDHTHCFLVHCMRTSRLCKKYSIRMEYYMHCKPVWFFFRTFRCVFRHTELIFKKHSWPSFPVPLCTFFMKRYTLANLRVDSRHLG